MSDISPMLRQVECSKCGRKIEYIGNWMRDAMAGGSSITVLGGGSFGDSVSASDQWSGVVCTQCKMIFCPRCMASPPGPCPVCGQDVAPATWTYVRSLPERERPPRSTSSGCFIATVCYGSADCCEVMEFRRFRDEKLTNTMIGRCAVRIYYAISPILVSLLWKTPMVRGFVRRMVLRPVLALITRNRREVDETQEAIDVIVAAAQNPATPPQALDAISGHSIGIGELTKSPNAPVHVLSGTATCGNPDTDSCAREQPHLPKWHCIFHVMHYRKD